MSPILLQSMPFSLSAYALCLFPLATVVVGLVTFFYLTDRHANRPYLRYNPFVAASAPPEQAARGPAVGETPAGPLGAPAGTTAVYTGGNVGDVDIVPEGTQPAADAPADYQPPFEGTNEGVGHTPADDAPPRPGDIDYQRPENKIAQVQPGPIDQPTIASGGEAVSSATAGLAPDKPAPSSPTAQTRSADVDTTPVAPDTQKFAASGTGGVSGQAAATDTGVTIVHVEFNPGGADLAGEYVQVANVSDAPVDLTGWVLRDQGSKHTFTFPGFVLVAQSDVKIWSSSGTNNTANLYWGNKVPIWNNEGDVAVLEDLSGNIVSRFGYEAE